MAIGAKFVAPERLRRCARTLFFMVAMMVSLLVSSLPVVVALADVMVSCVLVSSFSCIGCHNFRGHLRRYHFRTSLTDIPLVSVIRSLIIICVYSMCDGPALSHGPYLGTVILCSFTSILLLSIKACVYTVNSHIEAEASTSIARQRLHLKKSWGMPVLFLSSVVFALGHTVVAYRTSCRARRKLLFHRMDPDAVISCKYVFSGFHKVPRSPIPAGKFPKSDGEMKRGALVTSHDEGLFPVRLLTDVDSLFISCLQITLHFKLSLPGSSPRSVSPVTFIEPSSSCSRLHLAVGRANRIPSIVLSKVPHYLHRSYSNQFHSSSLYAPLLDCATTAPSNSEEIPALSLDNIGNNNQANVLTSCFPKEAEENGQLGIVLVHGFGGGVFSWRHVMGVLAHEVGCAVAAFDRPGWGLTPRSLPKEWQEKNMPNPYKLETQVDLLFSFCSEMGFSSVVLIGHDDGGLLALMAAQRVQSSGNRDNVSIKGVVLLGVSLSRESVPAFARILLRTSLGKKHLVRPLLRTEITQVVNRRAWYDATKLTAEVLSLYKTPLCVEGWDEALQEIGKLSYETILTPQSASSLLKAVEDLPILVIGGAEDAIVPLKSAQALALKLVNSRLVAISACGHLPHEECPKALLAAITPFISRLLAQPEFQNQ